MEHIGIFFKPYKNEFVYYWLNRLAKANGLSFKNFMANYMGKSMLFKGDFNYEVRYEFMRLNENCFYSLDLDDIYKHNTGQKFYNLFLTEMQIERVNQNYVKPASNLNQTVRHNILKVRVCPECLKEDACKILHVEHQIPEVTMCAKHGCRLQEFTGKRGDECEFRKEDYRDVPNKFDEETDLMLSKYISALCQSEITASISDVKQVLVKRLKDRGYLNTWNDTELLFKDIGNWKYTRLFGGKEEYLVNKIFPRKINVTPEYLLPFLVFAFPDVNELINELPEKEVYFVSGICDVCGKKSLFSVADKRICHECVKHDGEYQEFIRLTEKMTDGEYIPEESFVSMNNEVAFRHKECGGIVHIKPRLLLYGTSRCPCEKVAFDEGFRIFNEYKASGKSADDIVKTLTWNGFKLGQWVSTTRRKAGKGVLTGIQLQQLDEAGFTYAKHEKGWNDAIKKYSRYVQSTGNVHATRNVVFEGFKLGQWYAGVRRSYQKKTLPDEKLLEIREINPEFPEIPKKEKFSKIKNEKQIVRFDEAVVLFLEYRKEYNTSRIAKSTIYKGYKLGIWANQMRAKHKAEIFPAEQVEKLNAIGFDWNPLETKWKEDLDRYQRYIQQGLKPEVSKENVFEGFALGYWYSNLKISYRNGSLTDEKILEVRNINPGFMKAADG